MEQRELDALLRECISDCEAIGINLNDISPYVDINNRLKRPWARTIHPKSHRTYGKFKIEFAPKTLKANDIAIRNTMMHEVLHCAEDAFCHTGEWKRLATVISTAYPTKYGKIKRTASNKEMGLSKEDIPKKQINFELYCPKCGCTWGYTTFCNAIKHPERYQHPKCGCKLKSRGVNGREIWRAK